MRKTVVILAALLLLALAPACASWWRHGDDALAKLAEFLQTADAKVTGWCDAGYLPPAACAEWIELYAQAGENLEFLESKWLDWKSNWKAKVIDFIVRFLANKFGTGPAAYATGASIQKEPPDAGGILAAAENAYKEGWLTNTELDKLKAAAGR